MVSADFVPCNNWTDKYQEILFHETSCIHTLRHFHETRHISAPDHGKIVFHNVGGVSVIVATVVKRKRKRTLKKVDLACWCTLDQQKIGTWCT